jgi:hypothetical protein
MGVVLPSLARFERVSQRVGAVFGRQIGRRGEERAGEGIRTLDNQLGRLELYQLSYTRVLLTMVEGGGFEPPKA